MDNKNFLNRIEHANFIVYYEIFSTFDISPFFSLVLAILDIGQLFSFSFSTKVKKL
jgi:hypothetical protein